MADMNYLLNASERVGVDTLMKGATYGIIYAQICMKPQGVRLFLKLRAHPRNIFVKLPNYCAGVLEMSQTNRINKENLFVNFSYWGRQPHGDPIFLLRNKDITMPTYSEMLAAGLSAFNVATCISPVLYNKKHLYLQNLLFMLPVTFPYTPRADLNVSAIITTAPCPPPTPAMPQLTGQYSHTDW